MQYNKIEMAEYKKKITISRAQAVGKAARRLPPKSSQAEIHITGGARLAPLAREEYLIASYICWGNLTGIASSSFWLICTIREVQYVFKSKSTAFDRIETEEGEAAVEQRIGRIRLQGFRKWPIFKEGDVAIVKGAIFNSTWRKRNMLSNAFN